MCVIYSHVLEQEKKVEKFRASSITTTSETTKSLHRRKKSRELANQSMFYVAVFYIVWIPGTINRILNQMDKSSPFTIVLLHSLLTPLQGFLNALVYHRPKLKKFLRRKHESIKLFESHVPSKIEETIDETINVTKKGEDEISSSSEEP